MLERRLYDRRPRHEYVLTDEGAELVDMLMVMVGWVDKWLAWEAGPPILYRHDARGEITHVDLRCAHCGAPVHARSRHRCRGSDHRSDRRIPRAATSEPPSEDALSFASHPKAERIRGL